MTKLNKAEIQKIMDAVKALEKLQDEYRIPGDEIEKLKHQLRLERHNHKITKGSLAMAHARMKEAGLIEDALFACAFCGQPVVNPLVRCECHEPHSHTWKIKEQSPVHVISVCTECGTEVTGVDDNP